MVGILPGKLGTGNERRICSGSERSLVMTAGRKGKSGKDGATFDAL
jgi:hypothetical protein